MIPNIVSGKKGTHIKNALKPHTTCGENKLLTPIQSSTTTDKCNHT